MNLDRSKIIKFACEHERSDYSHHFANEKFLPHQKFLFTLKTFPFISDFLQNSFPSSWFDLKKKTFHQIDSESFPSIDGKFHNKLLKAKSEKNKKQIVKIINYGKFLNNFIVIPCHSTAFRV